MSNIVLFSIKLNLKLKIVKKLQDKKINKEGRL